MLRKVDFLNYFMVMYNIIIIKFKLKNLSIFFYIGCLERCRTTLIRSHIETHRRQTTLKNIPGKNNYRIHTLIFL